MIAVCRRTVDELMKNLQKLDPKKELEVGQYRLDAQGNTVHKKVIKFFFKYSHLGFYK